MLQRHYADYWVELADCYQRTAADVWSELFRFKTTDKPDLKHATESSFTEKEETCAHGGKIIDSHNVCVFNANEHPASGTNRVLQALLFVSSDRDHSVKSTSSKSGKNTPPTSCTSCSDSLSMARPGEPKPEDTGMETILRNMCELFRPYFHRKTCQLVDVVAKSVIDITQSAEGQQLEETPFHSHVPNHPAAFTSSASAEECQTHEQDHLCAVLMEKCKFSSTENAGQLSFNQLVLQLSSVCDVFVPMVTDQSGEFVRRVLYCVEMGGLQGQLLLVGLLMLAVVASLLWAR